MENLITQTENEKVKKGLIYADTRFKDALEEITRAKVDEVGWNIKNLMKSLELTDQKAIKRQKTGKYTRGNKRAEKSAFCGENK